MKHISILSLFAILMLLLACSEGRTPLMKASKSGDVAKVAKLINSGTDLDAKDWYGDSALYWAIRNNNFEIVKLLIDNGANVNLEFQNEYTPIITASFYGNPEVVKYLLEKGANPNSVNINGECALSYPAFANFEEIVNLLLTSGADPNKCTPLISASRTGNIIIVKTLISSGANINIKDTAGNTALIAAAENCHTEIAQVLLKSGANHKLKNSHGKTPLQLALIRIDSLEKENNKNKLVSECNQPSLGDCKIMVSILTKYQ